MSENRTTPPASTTPEGTPPASTTPDGAPSPVPPSPRDAVWSASAERSSAYARQERPRGPRSGTLVLGLVLALCGGAATAVGLGAQIDLQLGLVVLLLMAAAVLLVVPLAQQVRRRSDRGTTDD